MCLWLSAENSSPEASHGYSPSRRIGNKFCHVKTTITCCVACCSSVSFAAETNSLQSSLYRYWHTRDSPQCLRGVIITMWVLSNYPIIKSEELVVNVATNIQCPTSRQLWSCKKALFLVVNHLIITLDGWQNNIFGLIASWDRSVARLSVLSVLGTPSIYLEWGKSISWLYGGEEKWWWRGWEKTLRRLSH